MSKKSANFKPKDFYTKLILEAAEWPSDSDAIKKYKPVFWYSYRDKDIGGLRLTDKGIEFISEEAKLKTYKIDFSSDFIFTPQIIIWLDRYLNSPFFIDKKSITVITEKTAFELYMFSGDIRKYGLAKSMSARHAQD